jgi:hypothetical protein
MTTALGCPSHQLSLESGPPVVRRFHSSSGAIAWKAPASDAAFVNDDRNGWTALAK